MGCPTATLSFFPPLFPLSKLTSPFSPFFSLERPFFWPMQSSVSFGPKGSPKNEQRRKGARQIQVVLFCPFHCSGKKSFFPCNCFFSGVKFVFFLLFRMFQMLSSFRTVSKLAALIASAPFVQQKLLNPPYRPQPQFEVEGALSEQLFFKLPEVQQRSRKESSA